MKYIEQLMEKLSVNHKLHISLFGSGNEKRLTGTHETSSLDTFSYGVGNRAASYRIPTMTAKNNGKGYIEDRRPSSNMDPYVVTAIIADSCLLKESLSEGMVEHYTNWKTWKDGVKIITIGQ
jgi:glutamine synthetase